MIKLAEGYYSWIFGDDPENRNEEENERYKLIQKIINIQLLTAIDVYEKSIEQFNENKGDFFLSNEWYDKIAEEVGEAYIVNKIKTYKKKLHSRKEYVPDIFEEAIMVQSLKYDSPDFSIIDISMKRYGVKKVSELFDFLVEQQRRLSDDNMDIKLLQCVFHIEKTFEDDFSEGCGFILWDYDFEEFENRTFYEAVDYWLLMGAARGYSVEYLNEMLVSGGADDLENLQVWI